MYDEVRPLKLVDVQPDDASERARRLNVRFKHVNLAASPLRDVGGLGLLTLALVVTVVMPGAWWWFAFSGLAGAGLGLALIALRRRPRV